MRFLVRLTNVRGFDRIARKQVSNVAYDAVRGIGADIGNLRVSRKAVELDLLLDVETALQSSLNALEVAIGPILTVRKLDVVTPPIEKSEAVRLGLELFNDERYWESHEAWESAWLDCDGTERDILQGLILLAAAFVHLQKNEKDVALSVIRRSLDKLALNIREYAGIDLDELRKRIRETLGAAHVEFFKIESKEL